MSTPGSAAFVDESKRRGYTVVAVRVPEGRLADVRRDLRAVIPAGQRGLHFTSDSERTRTAVLATITRMPVEAVSLRGRQPQAGGIRAVGLPGAPVRWSRQHQAGRLVLELDAGIVTADQQVLNRAIGPGGSPVYQHQPPASDPGLWLADAFAWCWTKGGRWRERIADMVGEVCHV